MKKKIKDLTPNERYKLCRKTSCPDCPLHTSGAGDICIRAYIADKDEIDKMMERVIEVEE